MEDVARNGCGTWKWLCMPVLLLLPALGLAGTGSLNLEKKASFDSRLNIPPAIKSGCGIESKVIDSIANFARKDFENVTLVEAASRRGPGRTLAVTITDLSCAAGGAWSGPKHLTVAGTLRQNGRIIGTFTANRVAGSAARGSYKGTCSLLGRCARTLGRDIALWLQNPTMNARLGDAQ